VPLIHQLKLQYANPERAEDLVRYRQALQDEGANMSGTDAATLRDIWDAKLCQQLQRDGLLLKNTDVALAMSTDGVELFRKGKKHQVWPIVLQCYNLAPEQRFQEENIICSGVIPGPRKPKDIDSFLYPLIRELKILHHGVTTYNGATTSDFSLCAHVITVTADMPARDMLMGLAGYNSRHYCNYCTIRGCSGYQQGSTRGSDLTKVESGTITPCPVRTSLNSAVNECTEAATDSEDNTVEFDSDDSDESLATSDKTTRQRAFQRGKHMYCPLNPPSDVPRDADWCDYDPEHLQLRTHSKDEQTAGYFNCPMDTVDERTSHNISDGQVDDQLQPQQTQAQLHEITNATGIQRRSVLWDLPSLLWPWYVLSLLLHFYGLNPYSDVLCAGCRSFPIDSMHLFYLNVVPNMRDHWQGNFFPWERQPGAFGTAQQTKVKPSGELYCIPQSEWDRIDADIKSLIHPTAFGDRIRCVADFRKANQWKTWAQVLSPIILKDRLPDPFYTEWIKLVYGMTLATDYSVRADDIMLVRKLMVGFVNHYHTAYYRYDNRRLPACRAVFHALLHVADCMEWLGPMWSYSQWVVERMFGLWTPKVKQRANPSRNLSLAMLRSSWVSNLRYSADLTTQSSVFGSDSSFIPGSMTDDDERTAQSIGMSSLLNKLRQSSQNSDSGGAGSTPRYLTVSNHQSTLHHPVHQPMSLTVAQLLKLSAYLDGLHLLFPSTVHLQTEVRRSSGRAPRPYKDPASRTNVTVRVWQKCLLNDPNAPQGLFRTYIRSAAYEKAGARDSTYVRYEVIEDSLDSSGCRTSCTVGKFGRVHFFCSYDSVQPSTGTSYPLLLAWIEEIPVVRELTAVGAFFRVHIPARQTARKDSSDLCYFINVDSIACLTGTVSVTVANGHVANYMIEKDSAFL
jgi:hypothetical protein